jgi:hypothetical protein
MKTSYYQAPKIPRGNYFPVRISLWGSRWGVQPRADFPELYPTPAMMQAGYEAKEYYALLWSRRTAIFARLATLPKNSVLLCHEKNADLCHRRLFAAWLADETGQVIEEL